MWMALHGRLPTKVTTERWSGGEGWCGVCRIRLEDQVHALRDCLHIQSLWRILVPGPKWGAFFSCGDQDWLLTNLLKPTMFVEDADWPEVFTVACWMAWSWRNRLAHEENFQVPRNMEEEVGKVLYHYRHKWRDTSLASTQEEIIQVV